MHFLVLPLLCSPELFAVKMYICFRGLVSCFVISRCWVGVLHDFFSVDMAFLTESTAACLEGGFCRFDSFTTCQLKNCLILFTSSPTHLHDSLRLLAHTTLLIPLIYPQMCARVYLLLAYTHRLKTPHHLSSQQHTRIYINTDISPA